MDTERQLTLRSIIIGVLGSLIISTSSIYVALKMGALPWPIIFAALISYALLRALGNTNLSEVNVAHTAMSAGAMVAGGVAFTLPGIWIIDPTAELPWSQALLAVAVGTALGLVFSALMRRYYIDELERPFPIGEAAAQTLQATDAGGSRLAILGGGLGFAGIFTFLRDSIGAIPAMLFQKASVLGVPLAIYASPMMISVGYMAGSVAMGVWFIGGLLGHLGLLSILPSAGILTAESAEAIRSSLGIGLMVGAGVGVLLKTVIPHIKRLLERRNITSVDEKSGSSRIGIVALVAVIAVALMTTLLDFGIVASIICMVGTFIAVNMAAQSVGETGIDPMEVFAVIVLLAARALTEIGGTPAFLLACIVAVACGLAGDVMSDFKAGRIIGTSPRAQFIAEIAGSVVGVGVAIGVLAILVNAYGTDAFGPGKDFVAVQASVVAGLVQGVPHLPALLAGVIVSALLYVLGVPVITLGLGVYLPFYLTLTAVVGGAVRALTDRLFPGRAEDTGLVLASGLLGGEAIVGVLLAFAALFGSGILG